jgi:hypothetical protein
MEGLEATGRSIGALGPLLFSLLPCQGRLGAFSSEVLISGPWGLQSQISMQRKWKLLATKDQA